MSRISIGRLSLTFEEFDLQELIDETVERFPPSARRGGVHARPSPVPTHCPVRWDRFRIEQVIINLLVNAIKYGAGKPVHIGVELGGG